MVALPPISAASTLPGYARPVAVAQPAPTADAGRGAAVTIGGGAASSAIANKARQALVDPNKGAPPASQPAAETSDQPRVQLPTPPFSQSVGLYSGSTRVYVDIVQSGEDGRRIARVFGTPPAPAPSRNESAVRAPVNFVA